jgi:alkanesulfonate monooxygenase SsuD/methylene tetrahydromethanopterin reductase-like flavin-dependent oxidoreductase (luciferase family)
VIVALDRHLSYGAGMEFGIFMQGYVPGAAAHDSQSEHDALMREVDLGVHADKNGWKYVWITEHHALTEYSHISSSEVFLGYLAHATERIHLGSGIFNMSPRVNHPVRNAERITMLDHLSNGRFELGTGRGAGSHEIGTFNIHDSSSTREEWDEVIKELPRMWEEKDYTFQGEHFSLDKPHNILPKPYGKGHPPIWVACGSPPTYGKAGSLGIGALGFNFSPIYELQPQIDAYKAGIAGCTEPLGQFVNDNVMVTNAVVCMEDRDHAREIVLRECRGYLTTLVCLYHDTIPKPDFAITWPAPPAKLDESAIDWAIENGSLLCGNPEEVCHQLEAYAKVGVDQLVFGVPTDSVTHDEAIENLEVFGTHVIPEFDKDPVHRTTRMRETAVPKYKAFNSEPAAIETVYNTPSLR